MEQSTQFGGQPVAAANLRPPLAIDAHFRGHWEITCRGRDGLEKWRDIIDNIVVDAGLNHTLDTELSGGTQVTTWFVGLISGSPSVAAGNTLATHAGWTEVSAYSEAARQAWVDGGVSAKSVSNSASPAVFSINADSTTVGGAFLASASTGTSGTLYAAGAFTGGDKDLDSGDSLSVTFTATAAAS